MFSIFRYFVMTISNATVSSGSLEETGSFFRAASPPTNTTDRLCLRFPYPSGELVAQSCVLGVAHPPGYPLFIFLNAAAMRIIPYGSPAWRANLLNAG